MEDKIVKQDYFSNDLPDLNEAKVAPLELNGEYWSPGCRKCPCCGWTACDN